MYSGCALTSAGWYTCVSNISSVDFSGRRGMHVATSKVDSSEVMHDPETIDILNSVVTVSNE